MLLSSLSDRKYIIQLHHEFNKLCNVMLELIVLNVVH